MLLKNYICTLCQQGPTYKNLIFVGINSKVIRRIMLVAALPPALAIITKTVARMPSLAPGT